jgi:thiol-disulfide isomerase/thioredoxin
MFGRIIFIFSFIFLAFPHLASADDKDRYSLNTIQDYELIEEVAELQHQNKKTIIYFTAEWCAPCHGVFDKVIEFIDANPGEYELILIQYENQTEFEKGEELLGTPPFYPYGFVLNSINEQDAIFLDITQNPNFQKLQSEHNLSPAFQYSTLYILYSLSSDPEYLPKSLRD